MSERITTENRLDGSLTSGTLDEAFEQIRQSLSGLRYGTVSIVVQDGVVIQIERTERTRLRKNERT